jgi:chromosome segregation ATPase
MANISWQDIKSLSQTLEKKRAEMQRVWRDQGDREAYWRRELDGVRDQLAETRAALDERDAAITALEAAPTALHDQVATAQDPAELEELRAALEATQAQLDDLLETNTELQTQVQTLHEEMTDLRAGIALSGFGLELYMRNALDERAQLAANSGVSALGGPVWVSHAQPRTVGAAVTVPF